MRPACVIDWDETWESKRKSAESQVSLEGDDASMIVRFQSLEATECVSFMADSPAY